MSIDENKRSEIKRLYYAEHWKVGTIAKQLGLHRDTVKRALGQDFPRVSSVLRPRLLDPYTEFIDETLAQYPTRRATRLHDMLKERGYSGSVRTVRSHVRHARPVPKSEVYLRTHPLCGEQAQVDWAHVAKVEVPGGMRALWLFVMVLSYSRAMWAEFVHDMTAASLCRSLVRAAAWFGGLPRQFLFDNPKTIVIERNGDDIRFHPQLLQLCGQLRVQPRLCAVGKGNQKGRVERSIRYMRDRFLAARDITNIEQGNLALRSFIDDIAHQRPHPQMRERTVADVFHEERERLLTLPEPLPATELYRPVRVDKTAFIRFDTNDYSVPPRYARETLTLSGDDKRLRIFSRDELVATHPRCWGRQQTIEVPEHRAELLEMRRAARAPKGREQLTARIPDCAVLFQRWLEEGHRLGTHVARALKLLELYGDELLGQAVQEAIARDIRDPSALAVICERHRRARTKARQIPVTIPAHVQDCEVVPHPLASYDVEDQHE